MYEIEYKLLNDKIDCSAEGLQAGVDEAGRGPVIGPMIMALVEFQAKDISKLEDLGIKDSKKLTPLTRVRVYKALMKMRNRILLVKVPPPIIDEWVLRGAGLNALEAYLVAQLVKRYKVCSSSIFLDAPSNANSFKKYLIKYGLRNKKLIVDVHAEEKWIIVAAASIVAKVARDYEIEQIKRVVGFDIGSGYPSDPKTRSVLGILVNNFPEYVRKSWKTVKEIVNRSGDKKLDSFIK